MRRILLSLLVLSLFTIVGCSKTDDSASTVPSGDNCAENVAYLQNGVNSYQAALGKYPADVNELLQTIEGKGPFVEEVPECPSGNIYVIENGVVKEAPRQ